MLIDVSTAPAQCPLRRCNCWNETMELNKIFFSISCPHTYLLILPILMEPVYKNNYYYFGFFLFVVKGFFRGNFWSIISGPKKFICLKKGNWYFEGRSFCLIKCFWKSRTLLFLFNRSCVNLPVWWIGMFEFSPAKHPFNYWHFYITFTLNYSYSLWI